MCIWGSGNFSLTLLVEGEAAILKYGNTVHFFNTSVGGKREENFHMWARFTGARGVDTSGPWLPILFGSSSMLDIYMLVSV